MNLAICIPVYDDWTSALAVLRQLDELEAGAGHRIDVLLVDDGSSEPCPRELTPAPSALARVSVLRLRRNLGHQRAIAIGLTYLYVHGAHDLVVVMDGDGEDAPEDVPRLLAQCQASALQRVVFAQRTKRSEGLAFSAGYAAFRLAHRLLVGRKVEVGNFSVLPRSMLARLVAVSELWNHYAAAVYHARLPYDLVPTARAPRIAGRSKMNAVSLVVHGLSAISVYSDVVGVRLLALTGTSMLAVVLGLLSVLGVRAYTSLAIPGWATSAAGLLVTSLLSLTLISVLMALFSLRSRSEYAFLPLRDHAHFVLEEVVLLDSKR